MMTCVAATEVPVTAGLPENDEQSRRSYAPALDRPETSQVAAIAELAVTRDGEDIISQEPQQSASILPLGEAFADLFGFVQTMSEKLNLLRADVITLKAKVMRFKRAALPPDEHVHRPEVARYLLTLVRASSDQTHTHKLSKFSYKHY
jgi:hypothetical protein